MNSLHLQGYLCYNNDGLLSLIKDKTLSLYHADSIQQSIGDFFNNTYYNATGIGGRTDIIPNVFIRIYAASHKCDLDTAISCIVAELYGDIYSEIEYEGYSEYTITGYNCKEFTIGGHDLAKELDRYIGSYIHFVIEPQQQLENEVLKMTNLEKIRAMTLEEMAVAIARIISCADCPLFNNGCAVFHTCDE